MSRTSKLYDRAIARGLNSPNDSFVPEGYRRCRGKDACGLVLPLSAFPRRTKGGTTRVNRCRACTKLAVRAHRARMRQMRKLQKAAGTMPERATFARRVGA